MKRILCVLVAVSLLLCTTAIAEDWTCPSCGNQASGNFCNNCGTAKPEVEWICPNCGNTATRNFCNNCGNPRPTDDSNSPVSIDFENEKDFEAALNRGEMTVGKVVCFKVSSVHPKSLYGFNLWSGEHLNFITPRPVNAKSGDTVIAKITNVISNLGSWVINYDLIKVEATADATMETTSDATASTVTPPPALTPAPTETPIPEENPTSIIEENNVSSYSASDVKTQGNFQYVVIAGDNAQIVRYTGQESSVSLYSSIDGYNITSIGTGAFKDCNSLNTITIWADITEFGDYAFAGCSKLTKISIPASTTSIGAYAFENCSVLENVIIWGKPSEINDGTFKNCINLKKISVPNSTTRIGAEAFYHCSSLESATIWGDITSIGSNAFEGCSSLNKISIPNSTRLIGDFAFRDCNSMESVIIWGNANIGHHAFQGCSSLKKISISSGTEYIGNYAFEGCSSLATITLWSHNTAIGTGAFDNCPKLTNKPQYPVGSVPEENNIQEPRNVTASTPRITAIPTATPQPTPVPTVEPIPEGVTAKKITVETPFKAGTYRVGIDIEPGRYYFTGTGAADILYDSPTGSFESGTYKKEDSIWNNGESTAITLKNGTYFKITYNKVLVKPYEFELKEGEERLLATGTYHIGEDIPAGKYIITGTDAADILFDCPNDEFADGTYTKEGSIWKAGDIAMVDLKDGTFFRLTMNEALIKHFNVTISDGDNTRLPTGVYHIGIDIPAGKYIFVGTDATDILYGCNDDQFVDGTYAKEGSIWKAGDTAVLDLKDGTYFKITLNEILIRKYVAPTVLESGYVIPVGTYLVGVDLPAGEYTMVGTGAADIYYDCPNAEFTSGTFKKDGSIWSAGDTIHITLKENTYFRITMKAVKIQ